MVLYQYIYILHQKILLLNILKIAKIWFFYDKDVLNNYNAVWNKIKDLLKEHFNSELIYGDNDKYIMIKVDLHNTPFLNKNKCENKCYAWTSVLLFKSIVNIYNKYFQALFSNESKYMANKQETKIISNNHNDLIVDDSDNEYDKFN